MLCEVKVVDTIKVVTIRSTYQVENLTLYPLEVMLVDDHGHPAYSLERIVPGQEFPLPIEAASRYRVRIQPDRAFIQITAVSFLFSNICVQRASVTNGALRFVGKT